MSAGYIPGSVLRDPRVYVKLFKDEKIKRPLWEFPPNERGAVISERRRRFPGVYTDSEDVQSDPEYS